MSINGANSPTSLAVMWTKIEEGVQHVPPDAPPGPVFTPCGSFQHLLTYRNKPEGDIAAPPQNPSRH